MEKLKVGVVLDDGAFMPTQSYETDGGIDLRAMEDAILPLQGSEVIGTGVHLIIPMGYVGLVFARSGMHVNEGLTTQGVIDAGYTGEILVRLHEHDVASKSIRRGDRIAQVVIVEKPRVELVLRHVTHDGDRSDNGFGSTGR